MQWFHVRPEEFVVFSLQWVFIFSPNYRRPVNFTLIHDAYKWAW